MDLKKGKPLMVVGVAFAFLAGCFGDQFKTIGDLMGNTSISSKTINAMQSTKTLSNTSIAGVWYNASEVKLDYEVTATDTAGNALDLESILSGQENANGLIVNMLLTKWKSMQEVHNINLQSSLRIAVDEQDPELVWLSSCSVPKPTVDEPKPELYYGFSPDISLAAQVKNGKFAISAPAFVHASNYYYHSINTTDRDSDLQIIGTVQDNLKIDFGTHHFQETETVTIAEIQAGLKELLAEIDNEKTFAMDIFFNLVNIDDIISELRNLSENLTSLFSPEDTIHITLIEKLDMTWIKQVDDPKAPLGLATVDDESFDVACVNSVESESNFDFLPDALAIFKGAIKRHDFNYHVSNFDSTMNLFLDDYDNQMLHHKESYSSVSYHFNSKPDSISPEQEEMMINEIEALHTLLEPIHNQFIEECSRKKEFISDEVVAAEPVRPIVVDDISLDEVPVVPVPYLEAPVAIPVPAFGFDSLPEICTVLLEQMKPLNEKIYELESVLWPHNYGYFSTSDQSLNFTEFDINMQYHRINFDAFDYEGNSKKGSVILNF